MSFKQFSDKQNQSSAAKAQEALKTAAATNPQAAPAEKSGTGPAAGAKSS